MKKILMKNPVMIRILVTVLCIFLTLGSIFMLSGKLSNPETFSKTISSLDDMKSKVTALAAVTVVTSTAISAIPDDTATPIANQIADMVSTLTLILSAIYLEKYLLTIIGFAAATIIWPLALISFAVFIWTVRKEFLKFSLKLVLFGLAIISVVPVGVKVSDMIQDTYRSSIDTVLVSAEQDMSEMHMEAVEADEEKGFFAGLYSKIAGGVTGAADWIKTKLNNIIEAVAVMLVTSCLIPVLTALIFVWLLKTIWGWSVSVPDLRSLNPGRRKQMQSEEKEIKRIDRQD